MLNRKVLLLACHLRDTAKREYREATIRLKPTEMALRYIAELKYNAYQNACARLKNIRNLDQLEELGDYLDAKVSEHRREAAKNHSIENALTVIAHHSAADAYTYAACKVWGLCVELMKIVD